jgi:hypothetical protein
MRQNHLWLGVAYDLVLRPLNLQNNTKKGCPKTSALFVLWFSSLTRSSGTAIHKKKIAPLPQKRLKRWNNRANLTVQIEVLKHMVFDPRGLF